MRRLPVVFLFALLVVALLTPWLPLSVNDINLPRILQPPTMEALLGYDELGRPVLDRLLVGLCYSLIVVFFVLTISLLIGVPFGMVSAYMGGRWDRAAIFIMDVFLAFPGLLLSIALAGLLGPGLMNAVIALSATGWVGFARLARGQTLVLRGEGHVEAARALGTAPAVILWRHIAPLLAAVLFIQAAYEAAGVILAESTLSFLGLGVQPPQPSLGSMVLEGARHMLIAPHTVLAPGLMIVVLVILINMAGDCLSDELPWARAFRRR